MSNNVLNATVTSTSNLTTHTVRPTFQNNILTAAVTLNQFSSSVLTTNNIFGGSATINNSYFQTGSNNSITLANNIFGGQTTVINVAGNPQTNVARPIVGNLIGGSVNTVSAQITGSDLGGLRNTAIWGFNLNVTGSHSAAQTTTQGAAFFGRWNSEADGLADSARTVFAVGTGTAAGASRKTALYITSGSIVGVSGSLLVQGTSTLSGSLTVTGSLSVGGNLQFNVGDFYSTQTQSGSANVSGSVTYNNTGISNGVTLASNSRLTIANSGVYSITFSAQLKEVGGTDTIYLWLKKNGTNVADTGTKTVVRNNDENIMTVEYIVQAAANDYYEIVFQNVNGHAQLYYEAASGNIPATPSIITTVKQVR
jgi:hypothetical protein